jgi:putative transposase
MRLRQAFRFRLQPNSAQKQALVRMAGARRFVWNWALAEGRTHDQQTGKSLPWGELSRRLTALKHRPERAWLKEADSQALQQALADVFRAYRNFFERRARFPRFKSRKRDRGRFRIPQRVKVSDGTVYVPKIGSVGIRQSRRVEGETKSATFSEDASGHWYVTLVAEFEMPDPALPPADPASVVGIDLGLYDFARASNDDRVPEFFRTAERTLRRAQRVLSRREKPSKRRMLAKRRVALIHRRLANQRSDFLHKLTTTLVSKYAGICIEDLSVRGLARTKLAKSITDASFGEFRRQLEYKALWNRKDLVVVDRFFPSSEMCHECGRINDALRLADRNWMCACGAHLDRDLNSARNIRTEGLRILAAGYAERINARGPDLRLAEMGAVGVETRIPRL